MIYVTVAIAAAVTVLAAQGRGQTASGNYSGLDKIARPAAHQSVVTLSDVAVRAGTVTEVIRDDSHGVKRGPCGMPIIAADASIDPTIVVPIPGSREADAAIRQVEPPCGPFTLAPAHKPVQVHGIRRDRY
jgi:hypothetical protein